MNDCGLLGATLDKRLDLEPLALARLPTAWTMPGTLITRSPRPHNKLAAHLAVFDHPFQRRPSVIFKACCDDERHTMRRGVNKRANVPQPVTVFVAVVFLHGRAIFAENAVKVGSDLVDLCRLATPEPPLKPMRQVYLNANVVALLNACRCRKHRSVNVFFAEFVLQFAEPLAGVD